MGEVGLHFVAGIDPKHQGFSCVATSHLETQPRTYADAQNNCRKRAVRAAVTGTPLRPPPEVAERGAGRRGCGRM